MKLAGCLAFLLVPLQAGCASPPHPAADYTAEGLVCVNRSTSREELNVCRCALEKRYERPPVHCVSDITDGGTP